MGGKEAWLDPSHPCYIRCASVSVARALNKTRSPESVIGVTRSLLRVTRRFRGATGRLRVPPTKKLRVTPSKPRQNSGARLRGPAAGPAAGRSRLSKDESVSPSSHTHAQPPPPCSGDRSSPRQGPLGRPRTRVSLPLPTSLPTPPPNTRNPPPSPRSYATPPPPPTPRKLSYAVLCLNTIPGCRLIATNADPLYPAADGNGYPGEGGTVDSTKGEGEDGNTRGKGGKCGLHRR